MHGTALAHARTLVMAVSASRTTSVLLAGHCGYVSHTRSVAVGDMVLICACKYICEYVCKRQATHNPIHAPQAFSPLHAPEHARTDAIGGHVAPGLELRPRHVRARVDAVQAEQHDDLPPQREVAVCGRQLIGESSAAVLREVQAVERCDCIVCGDGESS